MTRNEKIEKFLSELNTEIDLLAVVDIDDVTDFDSLLSEVENNQGFNIDIIYYSNAIEYLHNNDPSLEESCGIAAEMGFDVGSLNSELLASLLASQNAREEFYNLESEVNNFFMELEEEEEDE